MIFDDFLFLLVLHTLLFYKNLRCNLLIDFHNL